MPLCGFCLLSPHHLVNDAGVGLDDLDDLGGDILVVVGRYWETVVTAAVHLDSGVHGLQEILLIDDGENEAGLVKGLWALGAGADAHGRERVAYACEEAALLWQGAAVADHGECVHLETVVVVESERLVLNYTMVKLESALLQTLARPWVARVQNRHVILLCHSIDGGEKTPKVLLGVDVLLAVGG